MPRHIIHYIISNLKSKILFLGNKSIGKTFNTLGQAFCAMVRGHNVLVIDQDLEEEGTLSSMWRLIPPFITAASIPTNNPKKPYERKMVANPTFRWKNSIINQGVNQDYFNNEIISFRDVMDCRNENLINTTHQALHPLYLPEEMSFFIDHYLTTGIIGTDNTNGKNITDDWLRYHLDNDYFDLKSSQNMPYQFLKRAEMILPKQNVSLERLLNGDMLKSSYGNPRKGLGRMNIIFSQPRGAQELKRRADEDKDYFANKKVRMQTLTNIMYNDFEIDHIYGDNELAAHRSNWGAIMLSGADLVLVPLKSEIAPVMRMNKFVNQYLKHGLSPDRVSTFFGQKLPTIDLPYEQDMENAISRIFEGRKKGMEYIRSEDNFSFLNQSLSQLPELATLSELKPAPYVMFEQLYILDQILKKHGKSNSHMHPAEVEKLSNSMFSIAQKDKLKEPFRYMPNFDYSLLRDAILLTDEMLGLYDKSQERISSNRNKRRTKVVC